MADPSPSPLVLQEAGPNTRVLLIHAPYPGKLKFDAQPSSLLSAARPLARILDQAGRLDELGYLDPTAPSEAFDSALSRLAAGGGLRVACISTSTAAIEEAERVANVLRASSIADILIVGGGPHEDDCEEPMASRLANVDVSIAGDAEDALATITLGYLDSELKDRRRFLSTVPSLLAARSPRGRCTVSVSGSRPIRWQGPETGVLEGTLGRPWASRTIRFPIFGGRETLPLMVSRGCAYGQCTFCAEAQGLRQRVADDFGILEQLLEARPGAAVYFQDSVFPATRLVRERLLPLLRDAGRPWGCQVYLPMLSREFARLLADHGCTYVYTGVESGLQHLRTAVGKPGLRDSLIRGRLNWLGEAGLRIGLSLMFGILGTDGRLLESEHSVELTVDLANQCLSDGLPVEAFFPNVLTVLPGTAVASALSSAGFPLDFYRMPRVPAFAGLEDGGVGYNFASLPGFAHEHDGLIQRVRKAALHVASLRRP